MKYGIKGLSIGWVLSGLVILIFDTIAHPDQGYPSFMGIVFFIVGIFWVIMDMRDYRKKQKQENENV